MIDPYIVLVFLLVFAALAMFAVALRPSRQSDKVRASLERLDRYDARTFRQAELAQPAKERLWGPVMGRLGRVARLITPGSRIRRLQWRVEQAGRPWNLDVNGLLALKLLLLVAALVIVVVLGGLRVLPGPFLVLAAVALGAAAYYTPDLLVHSWRDSRRRKITRALPDFLDLLTVTVEAGLGLESALARIASRVQGPLGQEILITLHHMRIGQSRDVALKDLAARCGDTDLDHFVATLIQSQRLGVSLGQILRTQSSSIRTLRRQRTEEAAQKAPVKMLFPLVFCIFPALFVVILGPAAIRIYDMFSNF